jgi:AIR synthase-related protein
MAEPPLNAMIASLRQSNAFAHKQDIAAVLALLESGRSRDQSPAASGLEVSGVEALANGDDCAALDDGHGGFLLFAMEGMIESFVASMPWFAGYSAIMVNVSDIYAMGGRPTAVIDAIWSTSIDAASPVLTGMREAARRYAVPLVGGHTNHRAEHAGLAVAILGQASRLLAASAAKPAQQLVMVVDLRGSYMEPNPFWNASTEAPTARLRADLELLPLLAEEGLCASAKDISMAGPLGTALMMLEAAGVGARIDLDAMPRPADSTLERWLLTFPSYGFLLSVDLEHVDRVLHRFTERNLSAAVIGTVHESPEVIVTKANESALLWDFAKGPFIGAGKSLKTARATDVEHEDALCP